MAEDGAMLPCSSPLLMVSTSPSNECLSPDVAHERYLAAVEAVYGDDDLQSNVQETRRDSAAVLEQTEQEKA